jgi:hypothetical protein
VRKRADQVLKYIIKEALSDDYVVDRADDIKKPGIITLQVIERLMKAPMVVADLTDANANVYYELAIRHFVKQPVVHLITEGQQPPFDVAPMRYIPYELTNLDSVARAAQELRDQAVALERGEVTLTVIQFAEMLSSPRGKDEKEFLNVLLGIQSAIANLQTEVRLVSSQVQELAPEEGQYIWGTGTAAANAAFGNLGAGRAVPLVTLKRQSLARAFRNARIHSTPMSMQSSTAEPNAAESEPSKPKPDAPPKEEK